MHLGGSSGVESTSDKEQTAFVARLAGTRSVSYIPILCNQHMLKRLDVSF